MLSKIEENSKKINDYYNKEGEKILNREYMEKRIVKQEDTREVHDLGEQPVLPLPYRTTRTLPPRRRVARSSSCGLRTRALLTSPAATSTCRALRFATHPPTRTRCKCTSPTHPGQCSGRHRARHVVTPSGVSSSHAGGRVWLGPVGAAYPPCYEREPDGVTGGKTFVRYFLLDRVESLEQISSRGRGTSERA